MAATELGKVADSPIPGESAESKVERKDNRYNRLRDAFRGLDVPNENIDPNTKFLVDQKNGKARAANTAFISSKYGVPTSDVSQVYDTLKADVGKQLYNLDDPSDEELYGAISNDFQREEDVRAEAEKVAGYAYNRALTTQVLEAPDGERRDLPWSAIYEEYKVQRGDVPQMDAKADAVYRQVFRDAFTSTAIESRDTKQLANELLRQLEVKEEVTAEGSLGDARNQVTPETFEKLRTLPKEEREVAYAFINANVDESKVEPDWAANTSKAFNRGFANIWGHLSMNGAEGVVDTVMRGEQLRIPLGTELNRNTLGSLRTREEQGKFNEQTRELTEEEMTQAREWGEELATDTDIARELRDVRQQTINPVKTDNFLAAKAWYPALEQVGFMTLASSAWTAPLMIAVTQDMRFEEMRDRGLTRAQARDLSLVSAIVEYPIERLQFKTLTGKKFGGAIGAMQKKIGKKLGLGGKLVAGAITQNVQEGVQDIMPLVVQEAASALSDAFPGVNWSEELKEYGKARVDTFWALLPMVVIGAGAARANDFKESSSILRDPDRLNALLGDKEVAAEIAETADGDMEAAAKMFKDARKDNPNLQAFDKYNQDLADALNSTDRPSLNPLEDGTVEVSYEDGTSTIVGDMEQAYQAQADFVNDRAEKAREGLQSLFQHFEGKGAEFIFDERAMTVEGLVRDEVIPESQARQRIKDLAAEQGSSFEGAALSQFPVHAQNEATFKDGVFRNVVRIFKGENPFAVVEDFSEGKFKEWIHGGDRSKFERWLGEYQQGTNDILVPDLAAATNESIIEALSSLSTAYFAGKVKESSLPHAIKNLFQQIATYFRHVYSHVFDRSDTLEGFIEDGQISPEFEARLAESVGLDLDERQDIEVQSEQVSTLRDLIKDMKGSFTSDERKSLRDLIKEVKDGNIGFTQSISATFENSEGRDIGIENLPKGISDLFFKIPDIDSVDFVQLEEHDIAADIKSRGYEVGLNFIAFDDGTKIYDVHTMLPDPNAPAALQGGMGIDFVRAVVETDNGFDAMVTQGGGRGHGWQGEKKGDDTEVMTGYRTWPKLGFEFSKQESRRTYERLEEALDFDEGSIRRNRTEAERAEIKELLDLGRIEGLPAMSIQKVYETKRGRILWDKWGDASHFNFDLTPNSISRKVFDANPVVRRAKRSGKRSQRRAVVTDAQRRRQAERQEAEERAERIGSSSVQDLTRAYEEVGRRRDQIENAREVNARTTEAFYDALTHAKQQGNTEFGAATWEIIDDYTPAIRRAAEEDGLQATIEILEERLGDLQQEYTDLARQIRVARLDANQAFEDLDAAALREDPDGEPLDIDYSPTQSITSNALSEQLDQFFRPPDTRIEALEFGLKKLRGVERVINKKIRDADGNKTKLDRLDLVSAAAQLEALISILPVSERGKVKGFSRLNSIATDAGRISYFFDRMERIDKVLEEYLAKDKRDKIRALVKRSLPKKGKSGKLTSTLGADMASYVTSVSNAIELGAQKVQDEIDGINRRVSEVGNFEEAPALYERLYILEKYGHIDGQDSLSLEEALEEIQEAVNQGRSQWRLRLEERKNFIDGMVSEASAEIGVGEVDDADLSQVDADERKNYKKLAKWAKGFIVEHLSFGQTLASAFGYGKVKNYFEKETLKARNANADLKRARRQHQKDWAKDTLGMNDPAFFAFIADLKEVNEKSGIILDSGKEMALSMDEAIYYTMIAKQASYADNLLKQGISGRVLIALEDMLTPEAKQLRSYLAEQYDREYDAINEVYKRINGVNLPRVRNYAPVSVDLGKGDDLQLDPSNPLSVSSGLAAGFTKLRTNHSLPIRKQGASVLYWAHAQQVDYYTSHVEVTRDMQAVLLNRDVINQLKVAKGSRRTATVAGWVKTFHEDGVRRAGAILAMDGIIQRITKTTAMIGLAYNIGTMMKQASAMIGSALDIPASAWARGFATVMFEPSRLKDIFADPIIQRRISEGFSIDMQIAMSANGATPGWLARQMEKGIGMIGYVDAMFTSVSAAVAYDYHFREAAKITSDPKQQRVIALQQTDLTIARTAQPAFTADRSLIENQFDGNSIAKMLFLFRSEMRQKMAITVMALRDVVKTPGRKGTALSAATAAWVVMPIITSIMTEFHAALFRDRDEDEEWDTQAFLNAMIAGQSAGLFFAGDLMTVIAATVTDQKIWSNTDNTLSDSMTKMFQTLAKIDKGTFAEEDVMADVNRLSRTMGMMIGGPAGAAIGVAGRTARDIGQAFESVQELTEVTKASPLNSKLDQLAEVDAILKAARKERRDAEPKKEAPELPPHLAAIKKLGVSTGARALAIEALIAATPEADKEALIKELNEAKLLSAQVKRQLRSL